MIWHDLWQVQVPLLEKVLRTVLVSADWRSCCAWAANAILPSSTVSTWS